MGLIGVLGLSLNTTRDRLGRGKYWAHIHGGPGRAIAALYHDLGCLASELYGNLGGWSRLALWRRQLGLSNRLALVPGKCWQAHNKLIFSQAAESAPTNLRSPLELGHSSTDLCGWPGGWGDLVHRNNQLDIDNFGESVSLI